MAIVHDYLTQRGGAERVVLALHRTFPESVIYTSLYSPGETFPEFADLPVRTSPLQALPGLARYHRLAFPALAWAFQRLRLAGDVVICSSSGWAHGVQVDGLKLVYCHTPARWLYEPNDYLRGAGETAKRMVLTAAAPSLKRWDQRAARSAARYIANSEAVKTRIQRVYGITSDVLAPPHAAETTATQRAVAGILAGFYLCVSRLLPYKNVDVLVRAFSARPQDRLVIVGDGPEAGSLRRIAPENVRLLGRVDDDQLRWLYAHCAGLIAISFEDFGLTPLEAAAFGKPTLALRAGGYLDTVVDGVTGQLITRPTVDEVIRGLDRFARCRFEPGQLVAHARKFDEQAFTANIRRAVHSMLDHDA